ncbi:hypothetical protein LJB42_001300 [Komagataella kurtzmanii]|nr:hypothetical protein LJB42_001300 [Komagataella kurtzmanii]
MNNTPLDELQWKSPEWIQTFGLRTDNVLEYFSQSPFFDRSSNNQVLKMQSQFNEQFQIQLQQNPHFLQQELKKMKGVEFIVAYTQEPNFWVIRKQFRKSPNEADALNDYYIIGANVYMAPVLNDVISSRLLSTTLALRKAMNTLHQMPKFSPTEGHYYHYQDTDPYLGDKSRPGTIINTPNIGTTVSNTNLNTPSDKEAADRNTNSSTLISLLNML